MAARSVVGVTPGFEVVGEAKSGEEALEQVTALSPQLVLMDINMDGMSGIEATRRITAAHPETRVILLSTYDAEDLPADARTCGALGYVHKEQFGPDVLVRMWEDGPDRAER
jgi:DNA-binding NarL/FixJ family response regulator